MLIVGTIVLALLVLAGWFVLTCVYYRHCMQQELLAVLVGCTRGGLPLHAAVRGFALDRPEPWLHAAWSHVLLALVLPGSFLWYRWRNYRRRLLRAADALEGGARLSEVLRGRPGLVSGETVLAATVGEASGQLADALEHAHLLRDRFGTLWARLAVHLVYPLLLAIVGTIVLWLQGYYVVPQMSSGIEELVEMGLQMPRLVAAGTVSALALGAVAAILTTVIVVLVLVQGSSAARWYVPGVAWYHRARVRAQLLEMLALLLRVGRPLPEAFAVLVATPVGLEVRRRLLEAARLASQGCSPGACLQSTGLAPRRWGALLESAQRRGHLPWAMHELGASVHRVLQRRFERVIGVVCPLLVAVIGGMFAIGCFASFYPLIYVIDVLGRADWAL